MDQESPSGYVSSATAIFDHVHGQLVRLDPTLNLSLNSQCVIAINNYLKKTNIFFAM